MTVPTQPGLVAAIEPPTPEAPAPTTPRTFTAEDVAKIRQEEKDKLYQELTTIKGQWSEAQKAISDIQAQRAAELAEIDRVKQEALDAEQAKRNEEMSAKELLEAKLRETNDTWESRFTQLQTERENERALAQKERDYQQLLDYRTNQISAAGNEIAPQFHRFINGETSEQIDQAIAQAKSATESIADEVRQAQAQQMSQPRGVSPTGYAALGPLDPSIGAQTYTSEQINAMSMPEYEKFRSKIGIASSEAQRHRGLFS